MSDIANALLSPVLNMTPFIPSSINSLFAIKSLTITILPAAIPSLITPLEPSPLIDGQLTTFDGENIKTSSPIPPVSSQFDGIGRLRHNKDPKKLSKVGILRGACLAARSSMISDIGSYDEDFFFYFEETEWCIRINRSKWDVMFEPSIKIKHVGGASTSSLYKESRIEFYRGRILYWKKVYPAYLIILFYLWNAPKLLIDAAFYLLMTSLTLNLHKKFRDKFVDRMVAILWITLGRPKSWGLPGKCSQKQLEKLSN